MGEKKKFLEGAIKFGVFMGDDVVPQTTIKELKELLKEKTDDSTFADVYCRVDNYFFYCDPIGGVEGAKAGEPDALPKKEWKKWMYFYRELLKKAEIRVEKSDIPETCNTKFLTFFFKYGYVCVNGWWFKLKPEDYTNPDWICYFPENNELFW